MGSLTNSEDPDEMPHDVAFHQGLHLLLKQKDLQGKKNVFFFVCGGGGGGNITFYPLIYTMDHHGFFVCSFMENSIGLKMVQTSFCKAHYFRLLLAIVSEVGSLMCII